MSRRYPELPCAKVCESTIDRIADRIGRRTCIADRIHRQYVPV